MSEPPPQMPPMTVADLDRRMGFGQVWAYGARGQGIGVAVLDTGIAPDSPLAVAERRDFTGEHAPGVGPSGHAAQMAETILAIAPEAPLFDGKIFPSEGRLRRRFIADALEHLVAIAPQFRIVNMSLWIPAGWGPLRCRPGHRCAACEAVNAATEAGLLVVAAAGNTGEEVECPGAAEGALTVVASITSAQQAAHDAGAEYGERTGTSFSAALVSGCAAVTWSSRPEATAAEVRRALIASAQPLPNVPRERQGAGVVHAGRAVALLASGGA